MPHNSYLILGSNLGDREESVKRATELIGMRAGEIMNSSSLYETEPWEGIQKSKIKNQKSEAKSQKSGIHFYLNQVLKILTELTPQELMSKLTDIEKELGRNRETAISNQQSVVYKPRTIDIDILFYDDIIINPQQSSSHHHIITSSHHLIIPHPLLHKRKFVLVQLCEIASDFIHPVMKVTMKKLLEECVDDNEVTMFTKR